MEYKSIADVRKSLGEDYDFLTDNAHLGDNIILLGYGGSRAYGTNNENSDTDIRGIATNSRRDILIGHDFEQVVDVLTDTTVYSFDRIIKLLIKCNPNTIELLGLRRQDYFHIAPAGKLLLDNSGLFLSQSAIQTFGGYANAQLRRLENKSARVASQTAMERNILRSIEFAGAEFRRRYFEAPDDAITLYVDSSPREDMDSEIFMDVHLTHYPLRDYKGMWSEMNAVVQSYNKLGGRNKNAAAHDKLGKHMMHLVRLYYMCFDILEKRQIVTYRSDEHDLLMSIRNGRYLDENEQPIPEFYEMLDALEKRLAYDSKNTDLPVSPDLDKIYDLVETINSQVCTAQQRV